MLLSDSKWERSQNSSQTKTNQNTKQNPEQQYTAFKSHVELISSGILSGAVVQSQLQLNKSSLSFEGMHSIIHSWTSKLSQGQIGLQVATTQWFIDSLTYWNQSRVQTIKSNLDLSTKQSYPPRVRRLGRENGQFSAQQGIKRITGNENFTKGNNQDPNQFSTNFGGKLSFILCFLFLERLHC